MNSLLAKSIFKFGSKETINNKSINILESLYASTKFGDKTKYKIVPKAKNTPPKIEEKYLPPVIKEKKPKELEIPKPQEEKHHVKTEEPPAQSKMLLLPLIVPVKIFPEKKIDPLVDEDFNDEEFAKFLLEVMKFQVELHIMFNAFQEAGGGDNKEISSNVKEMVLNFFSLMKKALPVVEKVKHLPQNISFLNFLKILLCYSCLIFFVVTQGTLNEGSLRKFSKLCKRLSLILINIFESFYKNILTVKKVIFYDKVFTQDFKDKYSRIIDQKEMPNKAFKRPEKIAQINKMIDKTIHSLKYSLNNLGKLFLPFSNAMNQFLIFPEKITLKFMIKTIYETIFYSYFNRLTTEQKRKKSTSNSKYTLVLDLDETLVHYFGNVNGSTFFLRPCALEFLNELKNLYDIVIFTAAGKGYADNILNIIDKDNTIFKKRYYKEHIKEEDKKKLKDLSLLKKDLSKTIFIDNIKESFILQPDNGLLIKTWISDINDIELMSLLKVLKDIYDKQYDDVRPIVKYINKELGTKYRGFSPYANININNYN